MDALLHSVEKVGSGREEGGWGGGGKGGEGGGRGGRGEEDSMRRWY